ncbi:hypothetical protein BH09BAC4_BH09BAC4_02050 [soil metagenome]
MPTLPVTKSLILTYFAGQASPIQKSLIKDWLKEEANQEQYFDWLVEWQTHSPHYISTSDARIQAFVQFMADEQPVADKPAEISSRAESTFTVSRIPFFRRWLTAASIVLLIGLTTWAARDYVTFKEYQTSFGETRTVELDDGTHIILNANSTLTVPRFGFGSSTRSVSLKGEAFFKVKHTVDNQKFLVKANDLEVVVYGTEFSVTTGLNQSKVLLKTGNVHLRYLNGKKTQEVVLKPGDLMTIEGQKKPVLKPHADTDKLTAWIDHRFVFERMPLSDVGQQIRDRFGVNVLIQDATISARTVSGTFRADNAEELVAILADMFDFQFSRQGNTITISPN